MFVILEGGVGRGDALHGCQVVSSFGFTQHCPAISCGCVPLTT
jgi:hypothetical protein